MEDKDYIVRFVCADPSRCQLIVSSDNGCSPLLGMGSRAFPPSAVSQLPSAHNNPFAKVPYFVVAYFDPPH